MKIRVKILEKNYEVIVGDIFARPIQAEIDGEIIEVWLEEAERPTPSQKPQSNSPVSTQTQKADNSQPSDQSLSNSGVVRAPIPGVIIEVKVQVGDSVVFGQELLVLEAMKMKNAIRAGKPGTISKVIVSVGDQVSQNQPLIEFGGEA